MSRFAPSLRALCALVALPLAYQAHAALHIVNASGLSYSPANITVAPGDTIRWVRQGGTHTVTSGTNCTPSGLFNATLNGTTPTFEWVVPAGIGFVPYFCQPHCGLGMVGTITVQSGSNQTFNITLDGDQETPPVDTTASGAGTATLDLGTNVLSWNITFSGLSSAQTLAHFHGPAAPCQNAPPVINLPLGSPLVGSAQLTAAQAQAVRDGLWYVNIHTQNFGPGEIRGQVVPGPAVNPIAGGIMTGDLRVRLRTIATGLTAPNWGTATALHPGRLTVADQNGIVWNVDLASGNKSVFLDVSARLVPLGIFGANTFDERGLLGIAFHPQYAANGKLYTFTSEPVAGAADFTTLPTGATPNCHSVIAEWIVPNPADPASVVNPASRRELMRIDKPQFNHNGGAVAFGPDGYLYIATGDGGGADDRDGQPFFGGEMIGHGCIGNGQNLEAILGKILRIDPSGSNAANGQYGIPADNPFVNAAGLDEIFAYGFRNPWRFSFDRQTGAIWAADVGQNDIEEINTVISGGNYGWRLKEGSFPFMFNGNQAGYVTDQPFALPPSLIDPVTEYDHDEGTAVVGGFVYRGSLYPPMQGHYVFGEFAQTFSSDGRLFYYDDGMEMMMEFALIGQTAVNRSILGFGEDASGEIYLLANTTGTPFGTTGEVIQLRSPAGDMNCDGAVDFADIDAFVLALGGEAGYQAQYPDCYWQNADTDYNGGVEFADIDTFVGLIGS